MVFYCIGNNTINRTTRTKQECISYGLQQTLEKGASFVIQQQIGNWDELFIQAIRITQAFASSNVNAQECLSRCRSSPAAVQGIVHLFYQFINLSIYLTYYSSIAS